MDESTRERVRSRAGNHCEYCRLRQEDSPLAKLHIEHFEWQGIHLVGKTPVGRVTVEVLAMNSDEQLALRSS